MKSLKKIQPYLVTDVKLLMETKQGSFMWIKQNHYGDFLIEETKDFRLWRNNDVNIKEGESKIVIEECSIRTNYNWEIIYTHK